MEGAPRPAGGSRPDPGYLALPVVFVLAGIAAFLLFSAAALSVSTLNYDLTVQPGFSLGGYAAFFAGRGPSLLVDSVVLALRVAAYAAVPALVLGYFLALKARRGLRQLGVFLLVLAWALSYERAAAFVHFLLPLASLAAWFPWLAVQPGGDVAVPFMWMVLPPMALSVYASLRGFFLGLHWRASKAPRTARFVSEAMPRGVVGLAFGTVLVGATVLADSTITRFYGGSGAVGIGAYLSSALLQFGYVTVAAVIAVVMLVVVVAAYAAFGAILILVRWLAARYLRPKATPLPRNEDRLLSRASFWILGLASAFLLVSLYIPLSAAAVFSFNHDNNVATFTQWSTRWWVAPAVPEVRALFSDVYFMEALWSTAFLALVVTALAAPVGFLAAYGLPYLRERARFLLRVGMYAFLVVPLALMAALGILRAAWDSLGIGTASLDPYLVVAMVPFFSALVFVVSRAALAFPRPKTRRFGLVWLRAAIAGALACSAFVLGGYIGYPGSGTMTGIVFATLTRKIPTPEIDAAVTLLSILVAVPMVGAFLVIYDREAFRL